MPPLSRPLVAVLWIMASGAGALAQRPYDIGSWRTILSRPMAWYGSEEAVRIADNVLAYQHPNGGWDKNIDMTLPLTDEERTRVKAQAAEAMTLFDNGATHTQIAFLMRGHAQTGEGRFLSAAERGIAFSLEAQHPNGGWPMIYPLRGGYFSHITYNDGAMIGVMTVLREVAAGAPPYGAVNDQLRRRSAEAVARGIRCLLDSQVVVDGKPTAWCAQHDEKTLAPAGARSFEPASLSGMESVGIVRFLMAIEEPSPEVVDAIEGAVAWFDLVRITGRRVAWVDDPALPGGRDRVVVSDPGSGPVWARFYEIGTNRPMYAGRDGVVHEHLADIEHERRIGYSYLGPFANGLVERDYPRWRARLGAR